MYAIYLRKSRQDLELEAQGQGETLARHRETLLRLAAGNQHSIGEIYAEVVSGETIRARPEMQRLLADVSAGRWEGVYCMEVERLSRGDPADQGRVAEVFTVSRTRIITPVKTYYPENDYDVEYFEFSLFMSRREYKAINRRIQAGRRYSVQEGKYIGSRPAFGYRKEKLRGEKGYTLAIHPQEAEIVREIFQLYLQENLSPARIAAYLTAVSAPVGSQGKGWSASRVYRLLTNEVYIGKLRWGKTRLTSALDGSGCYKRRVTAREYPLYNGRHPPIVQEGVFRAVQEKMHGIRAAPRHRLSNPLSGLLCCGVCGAALRSLPDCGRQAASVYCPTPGCPTVKSYRAPVLCAVLDALLPCLASFSWSAPTAGSLPDASSRLRARLEKERAQLDAQLQRLRDLLETGAYSVAVYQERLALLQARQHELLRLWEGNLARLPEERAPEEPMPPLTELFACASPELQNALLRACVKEITFSKSRRGHANGAGVTCGAHCFTLVIRSGVAFE